MAYLRGCSDEKVRAELIQYIIEADANIALVAHNIGYARMWVYNMIWKHELWPLVNRVRLERLERAKLESKHGISHGRVVPDEG